jgi:hypothetical protein
MAGPRREMRDVELVETGALDAPPAADDAPAAGVAHPRRRRRRALAIVLAAVVALVALGGSALSDRREDERLRSIAGRPDIVAPLDGPLVELWRGRGWIGSELREIDGRLVGVVSTPYRTVDVVGLEPRTGRDVWRTPIGPAAVNRLWTSCALPGAPYPALEPGDRPVAICVAVDDTTTTEQSALGTLTYPTRARLVVVDAVDGTPLRDEPAPATSEVVALGTDAVLAHVRPDGRVRVARVDPRTGAERWGFVTPEPAPTDAFGQRSVELQAAGDVVGVDAGPTWVLAGDGELVRSWPAARPPESGSPVDLLTGGRVVARAGVEAGGGWGTEVVDLDAGTAWKALGVPARARPDDGSLDDLVLLRGDTSQAVSAHDRSTGEVRWRLDLPSSVPVAVLDGRVVAVDGDVVRAVDGRTGAVLWTATLPRPARGPVVSDGRHVVVSASASGGGGLLTAVALTDGRPAWTTPVAHALYQFAVDGRLYGWSARGLMALGPADEAG